MHKLYPLTFLPIFKEKIWGGRKIMTILGKDFSPISNCGESWEISGVEGNVSIVSQGSLYGKSLKELINIYKGNLVGRQVYETFGSNFPLLVKFIDATEDLSVQVHPGDQLAKKRHHSFGKSEMWYIIQADPGAKLITGFNRQIDRQTYRELFESGRWKEMLNEEYAKAEDVFYLPAGRIHSIGKGLLLTEIQQTSDVTYRIFDFDRVDDHGNKRELHTELALDAIDYNYYPEYKTKYAGSVNKPDQLVVSPYFTTQRLYLTQPLQRNYESLDSFVIFVCVEGEAKLIYENGAMSLKLGDVVLLPASITSVTLVPRSSVKLLESCLPP